MGERGRGTAWVSAGYLSDLWFDLYALSPHGLHSTCVRDPVLVTWREDRVPCGVLRLAGNTAQGLDFLLPSRPQLAISTIYPNYPRPFPRPSSYWLALAMSFHVLLVGPESWQFERKEVSAVS